jgi:hypothetical protein
MGVKPKSSRNAAFSQGSGGGRTTPVVQTPKPEEEEDDYDEEEQEEHSDSDYEDEEHYNQTNAVKPSDEGIGMSILHVSSSGGLGSAIPADRQISINLTSLKDENKDSYTPGPYETDVDKIKSQFVIHKDDAKNKDGSDRLSAWYSSPEVSGHTKLDVKAGVLQNYSGKPNAKSGRMFFFNHNGKSVTLANGKKSTGLGDSGTANYAADVPTGSIEDELNLAIHHAAKKIALFHSKVNGVLASKTASNIPVKNTTAAPVVANSSSYVKEQPHDSAPGRVYSECGFCGEGKILDDKERVGYSQEHAVMSNGWCKSSIDKHNATNPIKANVTGV